MLWLLSVAAAFLCAQGIAHADAQEWRLGVSAGGSAAELDHAGASTRTLGAGGAVSLHYGLRNDFDVGIRAGALAASALRFAGAVVDGEEGDLYADLYASDLDLDVMWRPGVSMSRLFARTRPIVGVRAGVAAVALTGQLHLSESGSLIAEPDATLEFMPAFGASAGFEHRFGRALLLRAVIDGQYAGSQYGSVGASLEAALAFY